VLLSRPVTIRVRIPQAWPATCRRWLGFNDQQPTAGSLDNRCSWPLRPLANRDWPVARWRGVQRCHCRASVAFARSSWIALSFSPRKILAACMQLPDGQSAPTKNGLFPTDRPSRPDILDRGAPRCPYPTPVKQGHGICGVGVWHKKKNP